MKELLRRDVQIILTYPPSGDAGKTLVTPNRFDFVSILEQASEKGSDEHTNYTIIIPKKRRNKTVTEEQIVQHYYATAEKYHIKEAMHKFAFRKTATQEEEENMMDQFFTVLRKTTGSGNLDVLAHKGYYMLDIEPYCITR